MGNSHSAPPEPPPMMENPVYAMPDFNNIFHKGIPKMMQVADDMNRMTNYIMDLRNMTFGLAVLSVVGMVMFMLLKWHNGRRTSRGRRRLNDYSSEHSSLSRPYRTYPQKTVDWSLHHKIDMDKLMDHSGAGTPPHMMKMALQHEETNPNGSPGNMPNGHMQKASFNTKFGPPVKLMVEDLPYADQ